MKYPIAAEFADKLPKIKCNTCNTILPDYVVSIWPEELYITTQRDWCRNCGDFNLGITNMADGDTDL